LALVAIAFFTAMDVGEGLEEPGNPLAQAGGFFCFLSEEKLQVEGMNKLRKQLERFLGRSPKLGKGVYIAHGAAVLGDVTLGDFSSVWYNAVLRGDINRIVIGHHSNVQDNAVLHLADDFPCILGNYVTIGHSTLVGMGAVILDGAVIGRQSIIGAKALVTQGVKIPPGSLVLGAPAKVVRALTRAERAGLKMWAQKYVENAAYCLKHQIRMAVTDEKTSKTGIGRARLVRLPPAPRH
jgi:carbonic anhydrase/acetyltransferase-like protein (isoleucine patch superfamily)